MLQVTYIIFSSFYNRLPFRMLVRKYGCDLAYTPMIVSESFILSEKARDVEFTTNDGTRHTFFETSCCNSLSFHCTHMYIHAGDRPLVVQFAARNGKEFADAAELVAPFADAVDLNCGCPQR